MSNEPQSTDASEPKVPPAKPAKGKKTATENSPAAEPDDNRSLPPVIRYGLSILILAGAAAAAWGLSLLAKPTESQAPTALIPKVLLERADEYAGTIDLLVSGTVVPHREINVAAEVGGRVLKKFPDCMAGNFVEKDTPLIQIDPETYELAVETAKGRTCSSR